MKNNVQYYITPSNKQSSSPLPLPSTPSHLTNCPSLNINMYFFFMAFPTLSFVLLMCLPKTRATHTSPSKATILNYNLIFVMFVFLSNNHQNIEIVLMFCFLLLHMRVEYIGQDARDTGLLE